MRDKSITFHGNNAMVPTDWKKLMRGKTPTAYWKSIDAKLDNFIAKHPEWDKHKTNWFSSMKDND